MKKFFMAFVALATIAMVGCKPKNEPTKPVNPEDDPEEEIVIPDIAEPGAGKVTIAILAPENTPCGLYAVGSFPNGNGESWKEKDTTGVTFSKVADAEGNWYALTLDYTPDLALKVIAIPTDFAAAGWSFQWGKNVDPNDPDCTETVDHVIILKGDADFVFENGGQPKATSFVENSVVYFQVKEWAADPVIKDEPAKVVFAKHPWDGGEWVYREMEAKGNGVFELACRFGANGFNLNDHDGKDGEVWVPQGDCQVEEGAAKHDSVLVTFTSQKGLMGTIEVKIREKAEPEPAKDPIVMKVVVKYPADWTNANPTAWVWPTGVDGVSADLVVESEAEHTYSYTTPEPVSELNIIFRNGNDWGMGQTVNVEGIYAAEIHYAIAEEGTGNRAVTVVE